MGMITVPEHGEYTLTLREPSVNPCYSRRPDGSLDHGRRPHRRLRRGDALRRQGSGPRHGLARRAGRRGGRRRGHGVAPHRSRGGERARQRRRGVAAGGDVVVQEDRLDAPGPRGRRDRRAPRGHGRAQRRHLPRVPVRGPCRARPRAVGRRRRDGACRGRDPVRERPAARLARLAGMIAVADAETDDDLDTIVGAALALEHAPLLAGSAGLALPLAARLGLSAGRAALPGGRWLIVAGSLHEATRRQLARARRAGLRVLATAAAEGTDTGEAAATLAREAARVLATESFDLIVLAGGDTAVACYRTLDATRIDLVGAPRPGLAFGYVRAPGHPVLPVLTKAGGFGPPGLFVSLWKEAAS